MKKNHWPPTQEEQQELLRMLRQLSPAGFIKVQKEVTALFVDILSESKKPEELIEVRDRMLTLPIPAPPVMAAEIKKLFHEKLLGKKKAPFTAIKGGRRQKKIRQTLKGTFDL